jgi:uncharacterized protein (TIGR03118 family)
MEPLLAQGLTAVSMLHEQLNKLGNTKIMSYRSTNMSKKIGFQRHRLNSAFLALLLSSAGGTLKAQENRESDSALYRQINIVSDQLSVALLQDPNLINPWGTSFSATSPFWVNNAGSGLATLYSITNDAAASPIVTKQALQVRIPGQGKPTGQIFNNTTNFNGNAFLFVSLDGVISGWRSALGTNAEVLATRQNAAYTGATIVTANQNSLLLAANFAERTIDVFDGDMQLIVQLTDPNAPAPYAPFNVHSIGGTIYVAYARQDADPNGNPEGRGSGFINILDLSTQNFHRFISGKEVGGQLRAIDAPWGLAVAPSTFGQHADELLVGNFGSGTIMAFDKYGSFTGLLKGVSGEPAINNGLWALTFGSGTRAGVPSTLYFTAGVNTETHGLFGSIEPLFDDLNGHDGRSPRVPRTIAIPHGNKLQFHGFAQGVQIYTWDGASWGSAVPEATLFDDNGTVVATHFAGPSWLSNSGSKVVGTVVQPTAIVDADAIPWLLVKATRNEGSGIFSTTTFVHRVNTFGGKAPSVPGGAPGQVARVAYTADYFFYGLEHLKN